jgi:C4-dicarboxylate-specific signal transduction histidine kinase
VNDLALGALRTLDGQLKNHKITTRVALKAALPPVMGHSGQLQEVLVNLIQNAVDAMDTTENDSRLLKVRTERNGSDAISIEIEDTGPGIDPKKSNNIFDAFFTTKSHGIGLGLAMSDDYRASRWSTRRFFRQSAGRSFSNFTASNEVASLTKIKFRN